MYIDRFAPRIGRILESSPIKKSMIIPKFIIFVMTQYLLFDIYFLINPSPYINNLLIEKTIPLKIAFIIISMIMLSFKKNSRVLHALSILDLLRKSFFDQFHIVNCRNQIQA